MLNNILHIAKTNYKTKKINNDFFRLFRKKKKKRKKVHNIFKKIYFSFYHA